MGQTINSAPPGALVYPRRGHFEQSSDFPHCEQIVTVHYSSALRFCIQLALRRVQRLHCYFSTRISAISVAVSELSELISRCLRLFKPPSQLRPCLSRT